MINLVYDKTNIEGFLKELVEDQAPFALSLTMNRAQKHANAFLKQSMVTRHIKGGPTAHTLRQLKNRWPKKDHLESVMFFGENAPYMKEIIYGGVKRARNKRLPEPLTKKIGPDMTQKGNISRRVFKAGNLVEGQKNKKYFIGVPKGRPNTPKMRGIWRRDGKGGYEGKKEERKARGRLVQIVRMSRSQRQQRITFPADKIAMRAYITGFNTNYATAMQHAIQTAKLKL